MNLRTPIDANEPSNFCRPRLTLPNRKRTNAAQHDQYAVKKCCATQTAQHFLITIAIQVYGANA